MSRADLVKRAERLVTILDAAFSESERARWTNPMYQILKDYLTLAKMEGW